MISKNKIHILSICIVLLIVSEGCNSFLAKTIFGLNGIVQMAAQKLPKKEKQYGIRHGASFLIKDSLYYHDFIKHNPDPARSQIMLQPLQVWVFNTNGTPSIHFNNCSLPPRGLRTNIQLNAYGNFDTFPVIDTPSIPLDSQLTYNNLASYFVAVDSLPHFNDSINYRIVVFWSHFMGRQSKRFIKDIEAYYTLYRHRNLVLEYVNVDNVFFYMKKHAESKNELEEES